jgi:hypothetical protein
MKKFSKARRAGSGGAYGAGSGGAYDAGSGGAYDAGYVPKHIMLGIDGTWQAAFSDPFQSNVFRMNIALNYDDGTAHGNPQIYIYLGGVGTSMETGRRRAGVFGEGVDELILQAYTNLVSNCGPDDKIYLFGFSRGAVAVRALTNLISTSGLLLADSSPMIEEAWRFFIDKEGGDDYLARKYANTHQNLSIEFLGVWDTVSGPYRQAELFKRYRFGSLRLDPIVKTGVHILAMDETRKDFLPILWTGKAQNSLSQNLEQIWMPGVHCDIGGGYRRSLLSTVSLLLMIDRLAQYCPDVGIDGDYIADTLKGILDVEGITVNDEWAEYHFQMFRSTYRDVPNIADAVHTCHPLANLMNGKNVAFKGATKSYSPQCRPAAPTQVATFTPTSQYETMAKAILAAKLT